MLHLNKNHSVIKQLTAARKLT